MTTQTQTPETKETIQQKRDRLKVLSAKAEEIREEMLNGCKTEDELLQVSGLTVNQIIIDKLYKTPMHSEFKSFKGWMKEGFCVKKGEKAFLIWGRPNQENKEGEIKPVIEDDGEGKGTFFPVSFIFSNAQVFPLKKKEDA